MSQQEISRRTFVKGSAATLAAGTALSGPLAGQLLAAIDPNSH